LPGVFADREGTTDQPRRVELEVLATIIDLAAVLAAMLCFLIQTCFLDFVNALSGSGKQLNRHSRAMPFSTCKKSERIT
jgi:hypothetical protein